MIIASLANLTFFCLLFQFFLVSIYNLHQASVQWAGLVSFQLFPMSILFNDIRQLFFITYSTNNQYFKSPWSPSPFTTFLNQMLLFFLSTRCFFLPFHPCLFPKVQDQQILFHSIKCSNQVHFDNFHVHINLSCHYFFYFCNLKIQRKPFFCQLYIIIS